MFSGDFLFQTDDEVFDGAGDEVVGAEDLLEGVGELAVEFEQVEDFLLGGDAHFLEEKGLRHDQTAGLHSFLAQVFLYFPGVFFILVC